ncbi:hypothetical protein DFH09DRAFT_1300086 [Mycena vulgaris]|nr:hypothetical protein DFH09DRAFT_1300086 [Mycena vulgaris]
MSIVTTLFIAYFCALFFIIWMPSILAPYPQAAPVAATLKWAGETYLQGLAALAFLGAGCILSLLAYKWFTRAKEATPAPVPTPTELEDGTASSSLAEPEAETEVAAEEPTTPKEAKAKETEPITALILFSFSMAFFFATQVYIARIISLQKPFFENAVVVCAWLLRGFEILLVAVILLIAYRYVLLRVRARAAAAAAAAPTPAPVLLDDGAVEYPAEMQVEVFNEKEESKDIEAENQKLVDA